MPIPAPLPATALRRTCDPATLGFATTDELPDEALWPGQERAIEAIRLAVAVARPGYNLFLVGEPGSGRYALLRRLLTEAAERLPPPDDWCCVNDFDDGERPRLLRLPPGRGAQLKRDMQRFTSEIGPAITAAFDGEDYRNRLAAIQEETKQREESAIRAIGHDALAAGIALLHTPQGFVFTPVKNGETLDAEQFGQLPEEERNRLGGLMKEFGERLEKQLHQFPRWRREMQTRIRDWSRQTLQLAVGHLIEELKENYQDQANVLEFLDRALADIIEIGGELREQEHEDGDSELSGSISVGRYQINLLVDHAASRHAPVITEDNPTHANLFGRIDHMTHMGMAVTNFMLIRAGALHRANGGWLILDAARLLNEPWAWPSLKRALRNGELHIESPSQLLGLSGAPTLEPQPMPLDIKVALVGDAWLLEILKELDDEFDAHFKVIADLAPSIERNSESSAQSARLLANLIRREALHPFDAPAIAYLIDEAARLADDAGRLATRSRPIFDLMREADHLAARAGRQLVGVDDVKSALSARHRRHGRIEERLREEVLNGTLLVSTAGAEIGQVNGLAVTEIIGTTFGHPVRITATVRIGEGDVVDIEREAELGGALHTKGVMILASFLAARYARRMPLSLSASLVFEQSYGPVEGDSASLAELCALLSALAGRPIKQALAVTGSVNQHGRVQAIGGVNEKIEGFFDLCAARGLTGNQGVLIPESNVRHLMLCEDVVAACGEGRFAIYPVADVDAAIELLTGVPAGLPDAQGMVPEDSINWLVATELAQMSELRENAQHGSRMRDRRSTKGR